MTPVHRYTRTSKKSAHRADKESNVRFRHFKEACGGEISLSNCQRFLSAAGVRSSRVCLRVKVCPVKLSRTGIDPRYHSNGTVIQLWTWWDRTALAGFLCVLKHKRLLLCFPSSIFNMQFKMYVLRVWAVVFVVWVYKNMPRESKRHTLSRHDGSRSAITLLGIFNENNVKGLLFLVFKIATHHSLIRKWWNRRSDTLNKSLLVCLLEPDLLPVACWHEESRSGTNNTWRAIQRQSGSDVKESTLMKECVRRKTIGSDRSSASQYKLIPASWFRGRSRGDDVPFGRWLIHPCTCHKQHERIDALAASETERPLHALRSYTDSRTVTFRKLTRDSEWVCPTAGELVLEVNLSG